jgi:uncharacterized membrane protein YvbJ
MIACQSCGKALEAAARICPGCGALTGVSLRPATEPTVAYEPTAIGAREAIIWTAAVVTFLVLTGVIVG